MKIDKLYTLSQFVDYILTTDWNKLYLIEQYNEFLKQSLKKEMFVNSIEQKWEDIDGKKIMVHDSHYDKWKEAEKKVIFKGIWNIEIDDRYTYMQWAKDKSGINKTVELHKYETIHNLAEATNGQLELKNVEI